MNGTQLVIGGHLCIVHPSDQFSAVVDLRIDDCPVRLCFAKDERPELKRRMMKNLMDAYDQRRMQSASIMA